eukprot:2139079-Alexandrium_andersonii.AAC.1
MNEAFAKAEKGRNQGNGCQGPCAPAPGVSYGVLEPCGEARASVGRVSPATRQGVLAAHQKLLVCCSNAWPHW